MNLQENIQRILEIMGDKESPSMELTGGWALPYKNPMAMIQTKPDKWDGLVGHTNGRLKFQEMKYGVRAGVKNLKNTYFGKGTTPTTLIKLFNMYAPKGHGGNDPIAYANSVAKQIGVKTTDSIQWKDYGKKIARAIISAETGIPVGGMVNKVKGVTETEFSDGFKLGNI
jgi:hypothetical protein